MKTLYIVKILKFIIANVNVIQFYQNFIKLPDIRISQFICSVNALNVNYI